MAGKVLVLEPFCGGSHKQMIDLFLSEFNASVETFVLAAKKWHWRSRTSAVHFAQTVPIHHSYKKLFCSSVLNLTELIGLRPDLSSLKKTIYFHENQLTYPILMKKDRDFHYGYMQILSCLTADCVLFNSNYNLQSFLNNIDSFMKLIPSDSRPKRLAENIRPKCRVLYFPMVYPIVNENAPKSTEILHIVWNHRWEHDKNPDLFFRIMLRLKDEGYQFKLSVVGECYNEKPDIFNDAEQKLFDRLCTWGFLPSKSEYWNLLQSCHVVVSTAEQECFGISVLEATYCGCFPVCPKALSYPEIYPDDCLYSTEAQLFKKLKAFCKFPELAIKKRKGLCIDFEKFSWTTLQLEYKKFLS